jgi:hypothetical protein
MNGELRIDLINGVITFHDGWNMMILRVTHLPEPIPSNVLIDIVALSNLTSYTPLQGEALVEKAPEKSALKEWSEWANNQGGEIVPLTEQEIKDAGIP